MAFKVLVGSAPKGGTNVQQADVVLGAAKDLELQLNDAANAVMEVQGIFMNDSNPLEAEVIAVVKAADPKVKEK